MLVTYNKDTQTVTINGEHPKAPVTTFQDGGKSVQLRRARMEESGFDWIDKEIKVINANKLVISDETDIACLHWLITQKYLLNFGDVYISPSAINNVCVILKNMHVAKGSSIMTPILNGYSGMGRMDKIDSACAKVGFNVKKPF